MFNSLKYYLTKIVESHPYSWAVAWFLIHKLTFLLPHDKSYFALKHFCNKSDDELFVDIGANTGISALSFRQLNKEIPIYSVEPNPLHEKSLSRLKQRLAPFDFVLLGFGDREMEAEFYTPVYKGIVLHTFTSGSEEQVREAVGKSFGQKISQKLQINKSSSRVICLDQLNLNPSIIKIDAEGFDYNVLLGARQTLDKHRPFLMIEACHTNVEQFQTYFEEINFRMLTFHYEQDNFSVFRPDLLNHTSGGRNIFAAPLEKLKLLPTSTGVSW